MSDLCNAITLRVRIEATYHGRRRVLEPHAHGVGPDGVEVLVAFQVSGDSESGHNVGWKALHVDDLDTVELLDSRFAARPDYAAGGRSKNISEVHCCI